VTLAYLKDVGIPIVAAAAATAARTKGAAVSTKDVLGTLGQVEPVAARTSHAGVSDSASKPPAPSPVFCAEPMTLEEENCAEAMQRPLPLRCPSNEVSVISFNMLLKGFDQKPYYPSVPPELRAWPRRKTQLQRVILGVDADIYCMQEVEAVSFPEEFSFLADAGYESIAPKDDSKGKRPDMAKTAIFYKGSRLEKLWQEHRSRLVIGAFRHLPSGKVIYVASCHLEGAPWEVATRFTQMQNALASIRKHQKQQCIDPASSALIFAGDFNESEDGAVFQCLQDGGLSKDFRPPDFPDKEVTKDDYKHEFQMSDLYSSGTAAAGAERPPTFCAPEDHRYVAIDFVFYTHNTLRPAAVRRPFTDEQAKVTTGVGIPAAWHFSDHVPVGGVFRLVSAGDDSDASEPASC